jgi:hypothetical protein
MSWTTTAIWVALGLAASALAAPAVSAAETDAPDEVVSTGSGAAPVPEPDGAPATLEPGWVSVSGDEALGPCGRPDDRKVHGEVWGAVGSHDYRAGGVAVSVPVGECGRADIAVSGGRGGAWAGPYDDAPYSVGPGVLIEPMPAAPGRRLGRNPVTMD